MTIGLCLLAAGKTTVFAATALTLSWTHSVEKTRWEESWRVGDAGVQLVEARVKGSGAGMEPPEGSRLVEGWWVYAPAVPPQTTLILAASGATGGGWRLCTGTTCVTVGADAGDAVTLRACAVGAP